MCERENEKLHDCVGDVIDVLVKMISSFFFAASPSSRNVFRILAANSGSLTLNTYCSSSMNRVVRFAVAILAK